MRQFMPSFLRQSQLAAKASIQKEKKNMKCLNKMPQAQNIGARCTQVQKALTLNLDLLVINIYWTQGGATG
jgi:hypothetical protein